MTNRRDVELLISARETTGRTFKQVSSNIDALNRKIGEQIQAAERGEISLQELRKSQDALAQAGRDLSNIQGQIDTYRRLEEQQKKNGAAADKAKANFAALKAELAGLETVTSAQERKLAGLERKVETSGVAFAQSTANIELQAAALQRAGVNVQQLDTAQQKIITSARLVGQGFVSLGASVDTFSDNVRRARDAEQQLAAQTGFNQKILQARELGDASRFVQLYAQAVGMVQQSDNQLAALQGFRNVGQMAAEASRDMSQFVTTGQVMAISTNDVAQGLRAIVEPGREALRTLEGVETAIRGAAAVATAEKGSVGAFSASLNELSAASSALVSQGGLVDGFKRQGDAVAIARQQFNSAQADVQKFGAAMAAADAPTEKLTRDLDLANTKLTEAGRALAIEETKLGELSRALKAAGIDTNNLEGAQERLTAAAREAAAALAAGNQRLGRNGEQANGLFGLNPYELNNLGFQINDIVVSLISGQKPLTVFVQQGAQIAQIFPGAISSVARFAVAFAPLIAVVGIAISVLVEVIDTAGRTKAITESLVDSVNGVKFDTAALSDYVENLERMGVATEDAIEIISRFADEGLDPSKIEAYSEAAATLAERLGIDVADAADLLTNVMYGGIDAVIELNNQTGDLTIAELEHADALFKAGDAASARQYILDRVAEKNAEIAKLTQNSWTPAVNNLKSAFSSFADFLASVVFGRLTTLQTELENMAIGAAYLTALLSGKGFEGAKADAFKVFQGLPRAKPKGAVAGGGGSTPQERRDFAFQQKLDTDSDYAVTKKLTLEEKKRNAAAKARADAQAAGVSKSLEDLAVQRAIAKVTEEGARSSGGSKKKKGKTGKSAAEREAEAKDRKIEGLEKQLAGQLRQLDSAAGRGKSASLEDRLTVVDNKYQSIFDTLEGLKELGINSVGDKTINEIQAEVNAAKDLLKSEEKIKFFNDQINLLTSQRKDEIENIEDAQARGAKTVAEAYADAEAVNDRISPKIVKAARDALEVARAIAGAEPSPEMASMIAKLERIISGEATTNIVNDIGLGGLEQQEDKLNKLLKDRNDLAESYKVLNELGIVNDEDTRNNLGQAFRSAAPEIQTVVDQMRETLYLLTQQKDALTGLPLLSDQAYNAWLGKLEAIEAGLVAVDQRQKDVMEAARSGIAAGITNAYQTVADTIVGLVAGTQSWGDALNNVLNAGLSLLGSFLDAIAQVLVQMVALQVAKSLIGGGFGGFLFHSGGTVGSSSGRMRTNIRGDWTGAPRLHSGGGMGLRPDEYKAVLQRGEEVLTDDDPRHINNIGKGGGGGSGGGAQSLKQVLLLDSNDIAGAMQTRAGERSLLTVIKSNIPTLKQWLK